MIKKVVLVAPAGEFTEQLKRAFINNGVDLVYINDREVRIFPFGRNSIFLWRVVKKFTFLKRINNKIFNNRLVTSCKSIKPHILFVNKGTTIDKKSIEQIKGMGIITVNWFPENIKLGMYRKWFLDNYRIYDRFISFDSSVSEYGDNCYYVAVGVNPDNFEGINVEETDHKKYSCDVCFVGAYSKDREEYLSVLRDFNLKIFGWKGWENSSLFKFYGGALNLEESVKAYRCAKICVNMNTVPPVNGVNLKTFEIPFAGGFQLSDYRKDVDGLYDSGTEIEIFRNKKELREKVEYYLNNPDIAKKIALAGQLRAQNSHTLQKRVSLMLQIADCGNKKPL